MTLDEALGVVACLPATADLDLRQTVAVRTVCRHFTCGKAESPSDCHGRSAAPD